MFVYDLPLPASARSLVLPDREDVFLFAASVTKGVFNVEPIAPLYDELPIPITNSTLTNSRFEV
jgi:hypothetical protein